MPDTCKYMPDVPGRAYVPGNRVPAQGLMVGRFTFERMHNTKERIYFYESAENHKAKERLFESMKRVNFPGKHSDAGADQGFLEREFICIEYVGFAL